MSTREEMTSALAEVTHFMKYPRLMPWIGAKYLKHRILVIGESHYLPKGATYQHEAAAWYNGCETALRKHLAAACPDENGINWIDTSGILRRRSTDMATGERKKFSAKGHAIYRNLFSTFNTASMFKLDDYRDTIDFIAYFNYFQRPAEFPGKSIILHEKDKEIAAKTLNKILVILQPKMIAVVSKKAGKLVRPLIMDYSHIVTAHPSSSWWNRRTKSGYCGRQDLLNFLNQNTSHCR
ncbi:hypothetical protein [Shewanella sp. YIC-542]|uniref:hypothetical protein n=1 Tax=Shewanella mytili TaxID=3377111 RepID=UPI00398F3E7A